MSCFTSSFRGFGFSGNLSKHRVLVPNFNQTRPHTSQLDLWPRLDLFVLTYGHLAVSYLAQKKLVACQTFFYSLGLQHTLVNHLLWFPPTRICPNRNHSSLDFYRLPNSQILANSPPCRRTSHPLPPLGQLCNLSKLLPLAS